MELYLHILINIQFVTENDLHTGLSDSTDSTYQNKIFAALIFVYVTLLKIYTEQ